MEQSGEYTWRTVKDGRVRSSHAMREGMTFKWTDPPDDGHPGEAFNCRCWAEPVNDQMRSVCVPFRIEIDRLLEERHMLSVEFRELGEEDERLGDEEDRVFNRIRDNILELGFSMLLGPISGLLRIGRYTTAVSELKKAKDRMDTGSSIAGIIQDIRVHERITERLREIRDRLQIIPIKRMEIVDEIRKIEVEAREKHGCEFFGLP